MDTSNLKNIVVLKDLPSNIVEEAIIVLKENKKVQKLELIDREGKQEKENKQAKEARQTKVDKQERGDKQTKEAIQSKADKQQKEGKQENKQNKNNIIQKNSKNYIVNEAQMLIAEYISKIENKNKKDNQSIQKLKKKYKRLKTFNQVLLASLGISIFINFMI